VRFRKRRRFSGLGFPAAPEVEAGSKSMTGNPKAHQA
jgi:hypothetical protein